MSSALFSPWPPPFEPGLCTTDGCSRLVLFPHIHYESRINIPRQNQAFIFSPPQVVQFLTKEMEAIHADKQHNFRKGMVDWKKLDWRRYKIDYGKIHIVLSML